MRLNISTKYLLILILVFGFFVRVVNISDNPPSMYGDELTMVYDIYSILKTGHDQTGELLPLTFSMGAGRPAGYIYFSLPFIALFGPSEIGVRMLSVISGVGIIYLMFLLGRKLFTDKVGLIAAFFTSISIWDISLSRGGFESHFALFLALLGTVAILYIKEKPWMGVLGVVSWGLAIHTYPTYKLILPIFGLVLFYYVGFKDIFKRSSIKPLTVSFILFLIFTGIAFSQLVYNNSESRFYQINALSSEEVGSQIIQRINYYRNIGQGPQFINQIIYSKPQEYVALLIEGYLRNFSIEFLFLHGDGNPRHNMASGGELYIAQIPLLILGLWMLMGGEKKKTILVLGWLIIAPLATTLLLVPHALRNLFMLPPLILLSALGFRYLWDLKNYYKYIILLLFLIQFSLFTYRLHFLAPFELNRFWSYPAKQAANFALDNKSKYDFIIVNTDIDNIEYALPAYGNVDPNIVINQNKNKTELRGLKFKKIDNIYIGSVPESDIKKIMEDLKGNVLYIGNPDKQILIKDLNVVVGIDKSPSIGWLEKN